MRFALLLLLSLVSLRAAEIERIWLSHEGPDENTLVVNWETPAPGDSVVEYGTAADQLTKMSRVEEQSTLHHVAIELAGPGVPLFYRVKSGALTSEVHSFQGYPADELRVAVVAD